MCTTYIDKCRRAIVRQESAELLELDSACRVVIDCLRRFDVHASRIRKRVKERLRDFLRAAERRGLSEAAGRLQRARQTRALLERHSWMHGGEFDDARIERIYELLLLTHTELAQGLMWQQRRIAWLASANAANRCWCGLALATGVVDGASWCTRRRICAAWRVRAARARCASRRRRPPLRAYLSAVGVADLVVDLLHERRLPLNRMSAAYADRILTFDFCKYERAARNILEETVWPWHERQTCVCVVVSNDNTPPANQLVCAQTGEKAKRASSRSQSSHSSQSSQRSMSSRGVARLLRMTRSRAAPSSATCTRRAWAAPICRPTRASAPPPPASRPARSRARSTTPPRTLESRTRGAHTL